MKSGSARMLHTAQGEGFSQTGAVQEKGARGTSQRPEGMILVAALLCTLMRGAKLQESRVWPALDFAAVPCTIEPPVRELRAPPES